MIKKLSLLFLLFSTCTSFAQTSEYDVTAVKEFLKNYKPSPRYYCSKEFIKNSINSALQKKDPLKDYLLQNIIHNLCLDDQKKFFYSLTKTCPDTLPLVAKYLLSNHTSLTLDEKIFLGICKRNQSLPTIKIQSFAHLFTKDLNKPVSFFLQENYQPHFIKVLLQEKKLCSQGYYVFYHGQQNFFGFYQDFFTKLAKKLAEHHLCNYTLPDDFLFIRVPENLKDLLNNGLTRTVQNKLIQKRTAIMNGEKNYNSCLSVNGFLFGSTGDNSCSTWNFVISNSNCGRYNGTNLAKQFFTALENSKIYNQFDTQIKALCKEHESFFSVGRLLQIAIPSNLVDQCCFMSTGGATLKEGKVSEQMTLCKQKNSAAYGNEDHYCIVMTDDMALDPRSGIKVFGYNGAPKDSVGIFSTTTYQEHCKKIDQLIDEIIEAIKHQGTKQCIKDYV